MSGQPPKPQVELINNGATDEKYILVDSHGYVYYDKVWLTCHSPHILLRWTDTLGRYLAIIAKGNFCDFLFAVLCIKPLLKRGLIHKEKNCHTFLFENRPSWKWGQRHIWQRFPCRCAYSSSTSKTWWIVIPSILVQSILNFRGIRLQPGFLCLFLCSEVPLLHANHLGQIRFFRSIWPACTLLWPTLGITGLRLMRLSYN